MCDLCYSMKMKGTVIRSTGSWYTVRTEEGDILECRIKGKFRIKGIRTTNPLSVGDVVDFEQDGDDYTITTLHQRKNYIIRKSTNLSKKYHIIASNIDQLVLITSIIKPNVAFGFLDRMLVTAEAYDIPVLIVFNKFDLIEGNEKALNKLAEALSIYDPIGYSYILASNETGRGIDELSEALKGKTSLLAGHSGVGKSTIINSIEPELDLRTSEVSDSNEKGKHTTTFAEMHQLPSLGGETFIIDTPGVRSFGLIDFDRDHLSHYFPEMLSRLDNCRFNNCVHINEPGCAVKQAVEEGDIHSLRYQHYLSFYEDEDLGPEWES